MKNHGPLEGPTLQEFVEDRLLGDGSQAGAEEECEDSSPCRGGMAEMARVELRATPVPSSSAPLLRRQRKLGVNLGLRIREG